VHVAHADEGSQQVLWADVRPYLAGHYRASEQRADCFGQAIERKRREIRRAVNRKRQRGPEPSVDFEEHRGAVRAQSEFHHRDAVPPQRLQHRKALLAHGAVGAHADAEGASRSSRSDVAHATVRELGIGFVPYSPLGRGILTGSVRPGTLSESDSRRARFPRFAEGNLDANAAIAARLGDLAAAKGLTAAQLALAWLLQTGPDIVPIPGTKRRSRLEENAAAASVRLDEPDIVRIEQLVRPEEVRGDRHWDMAAIDR